MVHSKVIAGSRSLMVTEIPEICRLNLWHRRWHAAWHIFHDSQEKSQPKTPWCFFFKRPLGVFLLRREKKKHTRSCGFWLGMMTSCWLKGSQNIIVCDFYAWFDIWYWPESSKGIWKPKNATLFRTKKKQTIWDQKRLLQGVHLRKSVWFIWSHIHPATTSHPSAPNRNLHIALPTWHLIAHVCGSWGSPIMSPDFQRLKIDGLGPWHFFFGGGVGRPIFKGWFVSFREGICLYLYLVTPLSTFWIPP